jgi:serine acetyltransferase
MIGAGAVLVNKEIPPRTLAVGIPAKMKKQLEPEGKLIGEKTSGEYVINGATFKQAFEKDPRFKL